MTEITTHEAAARFHVSTSTFRRWAARNGLERARYDNRRAVWSLADVERVADEVGAPQAAVVLHKFECTKCGLTVAEPLDVGVCYGCRVRSLRRVVDEVVECWECGATTKHGKPYCTEHVELMPHVAELLRRLPSRRS